MTEKDILVLIKKDTWMMDVLSIAEKLNLPDWIIGAGFVRNKVWDYLHGYAKLNRTDVDLVYFDPNVTTMKQIKYSQKSLKKKLE